MFQGKDMKIAIRKFERKDIPKKVEWINNLENNQFLHYDIPLCVEKTEKWFDSHFGDMSRYDAIIEADGVAVGTIGLLNIDNKNSKAEYYVAMGETTFKGKGIAKKASYLILEYGFNKLKLNRIYLYTETENVLAQRLFESVGFIKEGCLKADILSHGSFVDRFVYGCLKDTWSYRNKGNHNS